jgi:hypothetical protein
MTVHRVRRRDVACEPSAGAGTDPVRCRRSGVRRRPAAPLCAALAQRGARGELGAAASAERVHANALRRHLAQDRPLHRDEERQGGDLRRNGCTAEAAPPSPRPHSADQLTKGLHGSLAPTGASPRVHCAADAPTSLRARDMHRKGARREPCPSRSVEAHAVAHAAHRLARQRPAAIRSGGQRRFDARRLRAQRRRPRPDGHEFALH